MAERSACLVITGWVTLFVLYFAQVGLLVSFLAIHEHPEYGWYSVAFLPAAIFTLFFLRCNSEFYADEGKIWYVWIIWGLYIVPYIITVATIFATIAKDLTKDDDLGINALMGTLCITPGLLVLLLHLTICPSYRKHVSSLSVFAALNIFDGIEMLEIFLMQKEGNFDLTVHMERSIVVFACFCFLLTSLALLRNEFKSNGEVEQRKCLSIILGPFEMFGTNLPFLVLRAIIWHKYEAAIFIAKNVLALVVGAVEFLVLTGMFQCGE